MPDLPTVTLAQAHYDRVVQTFAGATQAEKAAAYNAWVINRLIDRVEAQEKRRAEVLVAASLPARPAEPPMPALP